MAFDKGKFISDFTQSGMEEAQAELLADKQADMFGQFSTKQNLAEGGLRQQSCQALIPRLGGLTLPNSPRLRKAHWACLAG